MAGVVLIFLFGLLTMYTLEEVYIMRMKYGKRNYPELCDFIFGKAGYAVVCAAIFCFNFGGLCAQLMLFGSVAPDIFNDLFGPHDLFTKRNLILMGCFIFLPLSFLRDIARFTFTSFVSVTCIFVITGLVVFRLLDKAPGDYAQPGKDAYALVNWSVFEALGGLAYIYVCHDLNFNIIDSLENPTRARYRVVAGVSMMGTIATCTLIGVSGYLLFFEQVQANILQSFPEKDLIATIGRCVLALDATLTIPFTCFMPRISILAVLSALGPRSKKFATSGLGFNIVTVFVLGTAVAIAIVVDNLGDVFELVGGVSACLLAFLLPPLLVLKKPGLGALPPFRQIMTVVTLICGIIILVGSTVDIFI